MKTNIVKVKSFEFSLSILQLFKALQNEKEFIISNQLLRSASSIGANIAESEAAFSRKDFAFKIQLAYKEAFETKYWLELLDMSDITLVSVKKHLLAIDELIRILTSISKSVNLRTDNL